MQLDTQQLANGIDIQARSNDAESADNACSARADIRLTGYVVKVDPIAVITCYNALCTQHDSVFTLVTQLIQLFGKGLCIELCSCFCACADKYVMRMVMMVIAAASAAAALTVVMMMLVLMIMLMTTAIAMLIVMVMMLMLVVMLVLVTAAVAVLIVVVMMLVLVHQMLHIVPESILS